MADRDVRLRMLSGDKPRLDVEIKEESSIHKEVNAISQITWVAHIVNSGMKTVPDVAVRLRFWGDKLPDRFIEYLKATNKQYWVQAFSGGDYETRGLRPGQTAEIPLFSASSLATNEVAAVESSSLRASIDMFIDDGPQWSTQIDLWHRFKQLIKDNWRSAPTS